MDNRYYISKEMVQHGFLNGIIKVNKLSENYDLICSINDKCFTIPIYDKVPNICKFWIKYDMSYVIDMIHDIIKTPDDLKVRKILQDYYLDFSDWCYFYYILKTQCYHVDDPNDMITKLNKLNKVFYGNYISKYWNTDVYSLPVISDLIYSSTNNYYMITYHYEDKNQHYPYNKTILTAKYEDYDDTKALYILDGNKEPIYNNYEKYGLDEDSILKVKYGAIFDGLTKDRYKQLRESYDDEYISELISDWGFDIINKGYTIFEFNSTGMEQIQKIDNLNIFEDDADAVKQAILDGVNVIPVNELPEDFEYRYLGWIDTPENREAIMKYCKKQSAQIKRICNTLFEQHSSIRDELSDKDIKLIMNYLQDSQHLIKLTIDDITYDYESLRSLLTRMDDILTQIKI